jgi:ribosome-binding factor A
MTRRTERVGHVIQRELSQFILRELNDPRLGFLTISRVETTPDLGQAAVSVSVMGDEKERHDTLEALNEFAPRMRSHIAKRLHTRTVPRLVFTLDRNLDHGFRIDSLLRDIERGENPAEKDDNEEK